MLRLLLALDDLDADALARGLVAGGLAPPDVYDLTDGVDATFDPRMRAAFALVVGRPVLDREALRGDVLFEIATRARQSGVPCHAVVGADALDPFAKRILDLQHVYEATGPAQLEAAGGRLAAQLMTDVMPN